MNKADNVKTSICNFLLLNRLDNQDIQVVLDGVVSGLWIWDEVSQTHIHFHKSELISALGLSDQVLDFILNLRKIHTSWKFIGPHRMNRIVAVG